jgi:hypothetical protein
MYDVRRREDEVTKNQGSYVDSFCTRNIGSNISDN